MNVMATHAIRVTNFKQKTAVQGSPPERLFLCKILLVATVKYLNLNRKRT